jgi:methionyl-tRNA formyltransferase
MPALRVIFMGTPDFAVPALKSILAAGHDVIAVYTRAPQPKGRGQQVQQSPVHIVADAHNIPVYTPTSLKKSVDAQNEFAALKADVAVVAAYGLILPPAVLSAPRLGCLNIHGSILPRWRGASPVQHAVWQGDAESGVTIMQMEEGLDTGPMIKIGRLPITSTTTSTSLMHDLGLMGADLVVDVLKDAPWKSVPQPDVGFTYAPMLKKEDGKIDWAQTADQIDRQIRALNPWPGTVAVLPDGQTIKILAAAMTDEKSAAPIGQVLNAQGFVACGQGTVLKITQIQAPSGKRMDLQAFMNGGGIKPNQLFG